MEIRGSESRNGIRGDPKPMARREIEAKLNSMGDYVRIDYLVRCLKQGLDFDTRKFVLTKLADLYNAKGMYNEAGRMLAGAADINATFQGKINDYIKTAEFFVKGLDFDSADGAFNKAVACANGLQKDVIKNKRREMYMSQAKALLVRDKRKNAMDVYEKLLSIDLSSEDKRQVQSTLLTLYEKLGKVKEFYSLKRNMSLS